MDSFHVRTDDRAVVLDAIDQPALVSPATNGWVSVYPVSGTDNAPLAHDALSVAVDAMVVAFFCFDSDIAVAELAHNGEMVTLLVAAHPETVTMMMGSVPTAPVLAEGDHFKLWADLPAWISRLGQVDTERLMDVLAKDLTEPFAETSAIGLLNAFGITDERLTTAYRFLVETAEQDGFLHTSTSR